MLIFIVNGQPTRAQAGGLETRRTIRKERPGWPLA